jgi:hypothetical protein
MAEQHVERKSIAYYILAAPGEEKTVDVYKVSGGRKFVLERVQVAFPVGQFFELHVKIFRGLEQVKPTNGDYCGDGFVIADITKVEFGSGESVKVYYKNDSTTQYRECLVIIEGYEY